MNRTALRMYPLMIGAGIACCLLAWTADAAAEQIYHWVDEQGVNHYSQSPPPSAKDEVRTLEVDGSQPASYDPEEDRYNVAAQAEAMQALRDEMAENRKNRQQAEQRSSPTVVYYPQEQVNNPILYSPGGYHPRPPGKPPGQGHRPKPPDGGRPDRPTPPPEEVAPASKPFRPQ